ncbi:MAG: PQQ-dependent sugar dehydrogenase [Alphaproteobacteria bacterium]|nr:PQQ-dependent sugar dehydrogenase [Alphaproteobacteria bacterium]
MLKPLPGCLVASLSLALGLAAPAAAGPLPYEIEEVASGLEHPWGLEFLPDGGFLVTERNGGLVRIAPGADTKAAVEGVPEALAMSQGGLLDILLAPDFAESSTLFLSLAAGTPKANATRLVRATLEGTRLNDVRTLFLAEPAKDTTVHYGGRLALMADGTLLLTLGDGFDYREEAQRLTSHLGTIVRLTPDGAAPADNPFVGQAGARPEIWSYGHRNVQGIVVDPRTGRVYAHEHGPRGGDELNLIEPGRNYGWPLATYGLDYSGAYVSPHTAYEGTEQPLRYWVPSIAPSGMDLYDGTRFPAWTGDLFLSALVPGDVRRIDLGPEGEILGEEVLFAELKTRIRHVRAGPDGFLYLLTDETDGRLLRVGPGK